MRKCHRDTHGRNGNVKTEAETGEVWPQGKERKHKAEAGRGKKGFFARARGGSRLCQRCDFGRLASRTVREVIPIVLSHHICVIVSYSSPWTWELTLQG